MRLSQERLKHLVPELSKLVNAILKYRKANRSWEQKAGLEASLDQRIYLPACHLGFELIHQYSVILVLRFHIMLKALIVS